MSLDRSKNMKLNSIESDLRHIIGHFWCVILDIYCYKIGANILDELRLPGKAVKFKLSSREYSCMNLRESA